MANGVFTRLIRSELLFKLVNLCLSLPYCLLTECSCKGTYLFTAVVHTAVFALAPPESPDSTPVTLPLLPPLSLAIACKVNSCPPGIKCETDMEHGNHSCMCPKGKRFNRQPSAECTGEHSTSPLHGRGDLHNGRGVSCTVKMYSRYCSTVEQFCMSWCSYIKHLTHSLCNCLTLRVYRTNTLTHSHNHLGNNLAKRFAHHGVF